MEQFKNLSSPSDLMNYFCENMKYGFVYKNKVFTDDNPGFQKDMDKFYKLRLKEDFLKHGYGVCWDFCECEREFFEQKGIEHLCFFIESFINRAEGGPTHTFALFKEKDKWVWFEYAWQYYRGFHEYGSIDEALSDILKKFSAFYNSSLQNIRIYEMPKFNKRVNTFEFVEKCLNSKKLFDESSEK